MCEARGGVQISITWRPISQLWEHEANEMSSKHSFPPNNETLILKML